MWNKELGRWKVENETFNVLKNNGYHLVHNFGHGKQNLAMLFAAMNLLASPSTRSAITSKSSGSRRAKPNALENVSSNISGQSRPTWSFPNWQTLMTTLIKSKRPPEIEKQIRA
jgi:hypothetical protein